MKRLVDSFEIGKRTKILRKSLGISQEKLGEMLGVSFQQIQKYEKGINKLSPERLQQVAEALDTSISYFFEEKNRDKSQNSRKQKKGELAHLSSEELELLRHFRKIGSIEEKQLAVSLIKTAAGHSRKKNSSR